MFFWKKKSAEDTEQDLSGTEETVKGSLPEAAEADPSGGTEIALAARGNLPAADDSIRLFPGFEHEDFEVGFRAGAVPALVMRWKDGGDWFHVPAMFNRSVLAAMDERDSAGDLGRLMRSFGYDVEETAA